jgi:hypothetical protein
MDARWRELQRQVVVTRRAGRRVFSVDLRQAAAGAAVEARAHGQSVWRSAQRLGVGVQALQSWIVAHGLAGQRQDAVGVREGARS